MTKKKQGSAASLRLDQAREWNRIMREEMGPKRARRGLNALFGLLNSSDDEETNGSDGDQENTQNTGSQPEVQSQRRTGTEAEGAQPKVEESMKSSSDEEEFRVEARRKKPRLGEETKVRGLETMKFDSSDEEEAPAEATRKKPRLGEGKKLRDVVTMKFDVWDETSFLLDIVQFRKAMKVYPFANSEAMNEFVKYWVRPIDVPHPAQFIMQKIKCVEKSYEERDKRYHLQGNVLRSEEELAHHLGERIWGSKFKKDDDVGDDDAIGVGDDVGDVGVGDNAGIGDDAVGVGGDVGDEEEGQQVGLEQKDLAKYPNLIEEELVHHLGERIWGSKFKQDDDVGDDDAIGVGDDVGDVGVGDDAGIGDDAIGVGGDVGDEEEGQQVGLEQKDLAKYPNLIKGLNKIPSDYHAIRDEAIFLMEESEVEELDKQWEQLQKEKAELNEKQQGMITDLISAMLNAINSKTQDQ